MTNKKDAHERPFLILLVSEALLLQTQCTTSAFSWFAWLRGIWIHIMLLRLTRWLRFVCWVRIARCIWLRYVTPFVVCWFTLWFRFVMLFCWASTFIITLMTLLAFFRIRAWRNSSALFTESTCFLVTTSSNLVFITAIVQSCRRFAKLRPLESVFCFFQLTELTLLDSATSSSLGSHHR